MKAVAFFVVAVSLSAATRQSDVLIYGCTSAAAITAAIQSTRMGKSAAMVQRHLGGLSSGRARLDRLG